MIFCKTKTLRQLLLNFISTAKSIKKAVPMKDPVTSQIKTVSIRVDGPIAFVETTTSSNINPENSLVYYGFK
jgi:hypothetical protein